MSVYPEFSKILEGEDKERLLEVRRSIRSILPLVIFFLVSVLIVYTLIYYIELSGIQDKIPFLRRISPRWLALFPAVFLLEILRRRLDDLYVFSEGRVQHYNGRLSLNYSVPSVSMRDIRSVRVGQTIWGRIFDYGNVELGTAAQADAEMILEGVRDPVTLADLIEQFRSRNEAEVGSNRASE